MKPLLVTTLLLGGLFLAPLSNAHELWVVAKHTHPGDTLKAFIGYGHFPLKEVIAKDRVDMFEPLQLVDKDGKHALTQKGDKNYQYQAEQPIKEGSYLVLGTYKPTFWSKNDKGWKRQSLKEMPDATYCEQSAMFGKYVLNVGHDATSDEVVTQTMGQTLEMVPMTNPAKVKMGEPFPVKVLFQGKPLANETVVATFQDFTQRDPNDHSHRLEPQAFSAQTNEEGVVNIIPLREGFWKAKVVHKTDYEPKAECQKLATYATLTFHIGDEHHHMHKEE